jgi:hypothetical protein
MRDFNDDLLKEAFNDELKALAQEFGVSDWKTSRRLPNGRLNNAVKTLRISLMASVPRRKSSWRILG